MCTVPLAAGLTKKWLVSKPFTIGEKDFIIKSICTTIIPVHSLWELAKRIVYNVGTTVKDNKEENQRMDLMRNVPD
jgi:hypothetical protein